MPKMKQILWRPRPALLLSAEDQKRIKKNLRDYSKQFEEDDAKTTSRVSKEVEQRRQRLIDEWFSWKKEAAAAFEAGRAERQKLLGDLEDVDDLCEEIEEVVEEVIDEVEGSWYPLEYIFLKRNKKWRRVLVRYFGSLGSLSGCQSLAC
jgi:translation initiation factor 3 subunit B